MSRRHSNNFILVAAHEFEVLWQLVNKIINKLILCELFH
jgi:hypothetical protein